MSAYNLALGVVCVKKVFLICVCFLLAVSPSMVCAVDISASSAVLIDTRYGTVIYEKNSSNQMTMASTTKIMTAICAIEEGDLDREYKIDDRAIGVEGSSIYLTKGETLTLRELVYGLMLNSGNDAAVAIAFAVSGSVEDFASLMNEKAAKIGATNTNFKNPNGLDEEGHYTTAYDLAKITAYAMKNPEFKKIVSTYQTTVKGPEGKRYLTNHNKLLKRMEGCVGVKTGFTKKSGRCLVSACERDGVSLVAVTLNAPDDWNDHMNMMDYGFSAVTNKTVLAQGEYMGCVNIKNGTKKKIDVLCQTSFSIPAVSGKKYVTLYEVPEARQAPVKKGDVLGHAMVYMDDILIDKVPVVASCDVSEVHKRTVSESLGMITGCFLGK